MARQFGRNRDDEGRFTSSSRGGNQWRGNQHRDDELDPRFGRGQDGSRDPRGRFMSEDDREYHEGYQDRARYGERGGHGYERGYGGGQDNSGYGDRYGQQGGGRGRDAYGYEEDFGSSGPQYGDDYSRGEHREAHSRLGDEQKSDGRYGDRCSQEW